MPSVTILPDSNKETLQRKSSDDTENARAVSAVPPTAEGIPDKFEYESLPARMDLSRKLAEQMRKLNWPSTNTLEIGWISDEVKDGSVGDKEIWPKITGLTARLLYELLSKNGEWTYSTITVAKDAGLAKLLNRGGVGGNALWTWAKCGGVPTKIGYSRRFNSGGRILSYHSRAPAVLYLGKSEVFAVLVHNLNHAVYEDKVAKGKLRKMGLIPDPPTMEEASEVTDPESEDQEPSHPPPAPEKTRGQITHVKQMTH